MPYLGTELKTLGWHRITYNGYEPADYLFTQTLYDLI